MLKITNLGNYYKHYTQNDSFSLSNARKNCIKIYGTDPCYFLSATVLSWIAVSQKSFSKDY